MESQNHSLKIDCLNNWIFCNHCRGDLFLDIMEENDNPDLQAKQQEFYEEVIGIVSKFFKKDKQLKQKRNQPDDYEEHKVQ